MRPPRSGSATFHAWSGRSATAWPTGAMLRREVPEAREILRNLIVGRIVFTPRPETRLYEFSGRGPLGRLLGGTPRPVSVVTPAGFEPANSTCKGSGAAFPAAQVP